MNQQIIRVESTSGFAIAGLVFSILGWFTCGLLCIPGAILSFLGLLDKGPKGTAIAGLIVGFPGVLFFLLFGLTFIGGMLSVGQMAEDSLDEINSSSLDSSDQVTHVGDLMVLSGTGPKNSAPFQIHSSSQAAVWSYEPSAGSAFFSAKVKSVTGYESELFANQAGRTGDSGDSALYLSPGEYYIEVNSAGCTWDIKILGEKPGPEPSIDLPEDEPPDDATESKSESSDETKAYWEAEEEKRLAQEAELKQQKEEREQRDRLYREWLDANPMPDPPSFPAEKWFSDGLDYSTEGSLVTADESSVTIKKVDGSVVVVKRDQLSSGSNGKIDQAMEILNAHRKAMEEWEARFEAEKKRIESL